MPIQQQNKTKMTPQEYLEFERDSELKHEYHDGEIFAMVGASLNHNRISINLVSELRNRLKGSSCDIFSNDMRVKVQAINKYTYPDVVIVCGQIDLEKKSGMETLLNPVVIIEVLSDSTEAYDRGTKFQHYRIVPSLQEYILVSQHCCLAEKYVRNETGGWRYFSYENMEDVMTIESVRCKLVLSDIYYRVEFNNS
ncbi:MAG: Uma2 family endonuclease [Desulfamplus sp.]|nr:Uma2 family endonuclease [Desulfamplus sp.]